MAVDNGVKFCMVFIILANAYFLNCHALESNISLVDLESCKTYSIPCENEYNYYFPINKKNNTKTENFHLKFYVITSAEAHILLSPTLNSRKSDRLYKILIGYNWNKITYSQIRPYKFFDDTKSWSDNVYISNITEKILPIYKPILIEVIQRKDGTLLVYVPSYSSEPVLNFTDPSPLDIKYVRFTSCDHIVAQWFFSCEFDGSGSDIIEDSSSTEKPFTPACECLNGNCAVPGNCTCDAGFVPSNSNTSQCVPHCKDGCPNGFCYSPGKCACNTGYYMTNTNICKPVCESGCINGICSAPGVCECNAGFVPSNSNTSQCVPHCIAGCPNGFCYSPGKCACNAGYYMTDTNLCKPVCESGCINGICSAPGICKCNAGFVPSNSNTSQCVPHCIDGCPNGFYYSPGKCACNTGYYMTDTNICKPVCEGCINGFCYSPGKCACNAGYYMTDRNICKPVCEGCINGICKGRKN